MIYYYYYYYYYYHYFYYYYYYYDKYRKRSLAGIVRKRSLKIDRSVKMP